MIGKINTILTVAQNSIVQSIRNTQALIDKASGRLASGKDVNSAIDNPANYFLARSLNFKANDLGQLLDGISQNLNVIKTASTGAESIKQLLDVAEAMLDDARAELYAGEETSLVSTLSADDIAAILAANPGVIYSAATESFYRLAGPANWATANASANSATLIQPPGVEGVDGVTGHLANITSATENAFINALAPGSAWIGGSDGTVEGEWRYLNGPEAGVQFWQGGTGGTTVGGSYANWGGGEPNNAGAEDFVHIRADGFWNDLAGGGALQYVIEWDSSLFVAPVDPDLVAKAERYAAQYELLMDQIDMLTRDANYRGRHLLRKEDLRTDFNVPRTSFLITEGIDATSRGLGLSSRNFLRLSTLDLAREQIKEARKEIRNYAQRLSTDLNIMTIRLDFTQSTINIHKAGAEQLLASDSNEDAAELLALQTRWQLQGIALRLATQTVLSRLF